MIRLERHATAPPYFASAEIEKFRADVRAFFSRSEKTRRQERPEFPLFPRRSYPAILEALASLSHQKCAYCESSISTGGAALDRFRPKAGAVGLTGDFSTEHYWWLAYTWTNIYPCCLKCNKFKGAKFPVEGRRCRVDGDARDLAAERRLLVDPFSDLPDEHLDFLDNGMVMPRSSIGDVTIHTLELNRSDLVAARQRVAKDTSHQLARVRLGSNLAEKGAAWLHRLATHGSSAEDGPASLRSIASLIDGTRPYTAIARAVLRRWLEAAGKKPTPAATRVARRAARLHGYGTTAKDRTVAKHAQELRSRIVTRVAVHNFRGIRALELAIDYELGSGAPWTVLLGENAMGKSSILQAIALTLLAGDGSGPAATTPSEVLSKGTSTGWVKVWMDDEADARTLTFRKRARRFARTGPEYPGVLLGYGATRLLPRSTIREKRGHVRLENMFDPFRPLLDANRWLGELDRKSFDFVARALKDVLSLPRSAILHRVRRRGTPGVMLKLFGSELELQELSDGYQSVLGLTCDIIAGLRASSKGGLEAAEGLVVIDELGAHLHPRWRMRIVESLRRAFRRVQFIVSTHDPLCLRGLDNGEAVVLRRTARGRVFSVPDLPPIKGLRVDQLLTSEYFGLNSTMDPAIEQKYRELYRLLAMRQPSTKQTQRVRQLRAELAPFEVPGATRRERRLLEIIDKELAQTDEEPDAGKRVEIRKQSDRLVADLNRLSAAKQVTA
jgi:uncharacterized protein (TIGR02646 family)